MAQFTGSSEYIASPELMQSVNIALVLKKPMLIKGEPGTGKTMLAEAISKAHNLEYQINNHGGGRPLRL